MLYADFQKTGMQQYAAGFLHLRSARLDPPSPPVEIVLSLFAPSVHPHAAGFPHFYLAHLDSPPPPVEIVLSLCFPS